MSGTDAPWLDRAIADLGVAEVPGPKSNPRIIEYGKLAGVEWYRDDATAWCAISMNAWLVEAGYPSTKSALARSFANYGTRLPAPKRGAIVVFPRGTNPLYGHVGVVESVNAKAGTVTVVNGNVSNEVRRSVFKTSSILPDGIRWPPEQGRPGVVTASVDEDLGARTLRKGDAGPDVEELQELLATVGLMTNDPNIDVFGTDTLAAVRKFQKENGLTVDGIVGPATLSALRSTADRKAERAATVKAESKGAAVGGGAVATGGAAIIATGAASEVAGAAREAGSALKDVGSVLGDMAPLFIAVAVAAALGFFGWRWYRGRRAA